jgi:hypothetical protein
MKKGAKEAGLAYPKGIFPALNTTKLLTDLSGLTYGKSQTRVFLLKSYYDHEQIEWLQFGEADLYREGDTLVRGRWRLEARLEHVTDWEHSNAIALRLPLVGVELGPLPVRSGHVSLTGWVDPNLDTDDEHNGFHVPRPGYNPCLHPEFSKCTSCKGNNAHFMVPPGFYVPPFDRELYKAVRGKRLEIHLGRPFA